MSRANSKGILVLLSVCLISMTGWSQDVLVPVHIQFRLLVSILHYEISFHERVSRHQHRQDTSDTGAVEGSIEVDSSFVSGNDAAVNNIHLMVLYQAENRKSAVIKEKLMAYIDQDKVAEIRDFNLVTMEHSYQNSEIFDSIALSQDIEIVIVAPLFGVDWKKLFAVTQKNDILSFSTVPENIEKGASVCISVKDNMPQIIINKHSTLAEGVEFSKELYANPSVIEYDSE